MSKILITLGAVLVIIGAFWPWLKKTGIGKLPGDILIQKGSFTFYFPLVTCALISLVITLVFWFMNK